MARIKSIEVMFIAKGGIPYNFMIGGDGRVYEIRGFMHQGNTTSSEFGSSFDNIGISVAFIGTFVDREPSESLLQTYFKFVPNAIRRDLLDDQYQVVFRDHLINADEPALGLLNVISKWSNFRHSKNSYYLMDE